MSMPQKIRKLFSTIDKLFETIVLIAFIAMVTVGFAQVIYRYVFRNSLSWSEEFQKYMHIWIIFLAIPLAYKDDAHIGMRVLYDKFPQKIQKVLGLIIDFMWLVFGFVISIYTIKIMKVASYQQSPGLGIQMSLVYSCILIGGIYIVFIALRKFADRLLPPLEGPEL